MKFQQPNSDDIRSAYLQGEEAVEKLVCGLVETINELMAIVQKQGEMIQKLQDQISKNSQNSSKPPSSDGFKKERKIVSLRKSGQKPNGGQKGHKGHTLNQTKTPDEIQVHTLHECSGCGASLENAALAGHEKRQVFDLPPIHIYVTEHQAEIKNCPECGSVNKAEFPDEAARPAQYGSGIKSYASYFNNHHHIPLERTAEIFEDVFGHRISEASVIQSSRECFQKTAPSDEAVKAALINSEAVYFDESGSRVKSSLKWLHTASTDKLTHYSIHEKRGRKAMDEIGILPNFQGIAVHDNWKPYFQYDCEHSLCNAHHLRELKFIYERHFQFWASDMSDLLLDIKKEMEKLPFEQRFLDQARISEYESKYDEIVESGMQANPPPQRPPGKKGRLRQSPSKNLLDRFKERKSEILRFMHDPRVSFDNNQAERDVRMIKVKQKVSGCFRTDDGASIFCRVRGYISTAKKNGLNVIKAIKDAFDGKPFIPDFTS